MKELSVSSNTVSRLIPYDNWLVGMDISPVTGWRWRKSGMIKAIAIHGRVYISRDEIERFEQRAIEGEFTK